jgi:flagellum-specific ATP synthase
MLFGLTSGIRRGDRVRLGEASPMARVSDSLLGRVVDGFGRPIDQGPPMRETQVRPLQPLPVDPLKRVSIDEPLGTGVRAIDTMVTAGRGQRLGVFSGPGVGKSTLLSMMARYTDADVSVIALIGERGREVRDFVDSSLGSEGLSRSVVVAATGDEPAPMRMRAAMYACAVAEHFRDQGRDVLFLMDSVTRVCQAQRQIGLAAGEPPATKGFTPSVFSMLPMLLERSGRTDRGSITGFYAILVEGDDLTEPVSDACRGILDGHVVLSRSLAHRDHWPAIDVLESISRVARDVTDSQHQQARAEAVRLLSLYAEVEDLVNIGAYARGSNPDYDLAIDMRETIDALLRQAPDAGESFADARKKLLHTALQIARQRQAAEQAGNRPAATSP